MRSQGHFIRGDHIPPGHRADVGHIEAVGTDHRALSAEGAGVHRLVELVVAHDDLGVVVDFLGQKAGVFLIVFQISAALHALFTVALDAPRCLFRCFFHGISALLQWHAAEGRGLVQVCVESALYGPLTAAHVARVQVLGQAVHREGGLLCAESSSHHARTAADHEFFRFEDHERRIRLR